jgi:hypothetical protein
MLCGCFRHVTLSNIHVNIFFYFAFVLMLLRYCFAYRNRKRRDIIIILKTVKFNFLMLTDTVVSRPLKYVANWR